MLRTTCSNTSGSGYGKDKTSIHNLHVTENGLRCVGAYVLVFESNRSSDEDLKEKLRCWHFGSENGFNMGFIAWNTAEHHAEPYWPKLDLSKVELARPEEFAPWELSVVGVDKETLQIL